MLAVDPSSSLSGGSILGDKTRMERLSVARAARSSGRARAAARSAASPRATREAIRVVEAAGFDVVIVETVGVGQSEAAVAGMTDLFLLMQLPNAGDDLQAIKKGVLELADLVVVNKADLDPAAAARAVGQLESAMQLAAPREGASGSGRGCSPAARSTRARCASSADAAAAWAAERRASGALARGAASARRAPGCRSGSTPGWRSASAPTRGCRLCCRRPSPRSMPAGCRSRSRRGRLLRAFAGEPDADNSQD